MIFLPIFLAKTPRTFGSRAPRSQRSNSIFLPESQKISGNNPLLMFPNKSFLLLLLFLSVQMFVFANDVFDFPVTGSNQARYNEICAQLSRQPLVKGTFEQTKTISRLGRSLNSRGNFIIAAELGMVWETLSPFPSTMAVGSDFIIQIAPNGAKSRLDAQGNETFTSLADTISAVFTGNSRILTEKFDNYFTENRQNGTWTVGLIPKDNAVRIFAEKIVLSGRNNPVVITTIEIHSQNGDVIRYTLQNHRFPASLTNDEKALFSL